MDGPYAIKEVVDLSMPVKSLDTPVFPGHPQPVKGIVHTLKDDGYLNYLWTFSEHTSTHTDAPIHMVEGGEPIDKVPLRHYVGKGLVVDLSDKPRLHQISARDMKEALRVAGFTARSGKGVILLIHTGISAKNRTPEWLEYPDLTKEACELIASMEFEAVGLDSPSPDKPPFVAHKTLLPKNVMVYENLANLDRVKGKDFLFVGLPLALVGGTGSPCRAVAIVM